MNPPTRRPDPAFAELDACGLNLQAVFDVRRLPADVRETLPAGARERYRQLLLVGNAGPAFWEHATATACTASIRSTRSPARACSRGSRGASPASGISGSTPAARVSLRFNGWAGSPAGTDPRRSWWA